MARLAAWALVSAVCLGACADLGPKRQPVELAEVATIDIARHGAAPRTLDPEEAASFVESWNQAMPVGLCNYAVEYWIDLRLKDGRAMQYRANGNTIKSTATKDYCFTVSDSDLFGRLWNINESRRDPARR
jgi:hypothetical protein